MLSSDSDELHDDGLQEEFEHLFQDRAGRRHRRSQNRHQSRRTRRALELADIAETTAAEGELTLTYRPAEHEAGWLLQSLTHFFEREQIEDVLYIVKGGKEANVYCCAAEPSLNTALVAVKVYRPHMFRKIRNDAQYREGRAALDAQGRPIVRDIRTFRAVALKSRYGQRVERVSWLMHEFTFQKQLFAAGGAVPRPWEAGNNAILMEFIGDESGAAPTLHAVSLDPHEVKPLFHLILENIELMLSLGRIHGDLSAFNILYWRGKISIIDFPQVISAHGNPGAAQILFRDVQRICDYFQRQGLTVNAAGVADELWRRYLAPDPEMQRADWSRWADDYS